MPVAIPAHGGFKPRRSPERGAKNFLHPLRDEPMPSQSGFETHIGRAVDRWGQGEGNHRLVPQIKTPTQGDQLPSRKHARDFHTGITVSCQRVLEVPVGDQGGQGDEVEGMLYRHRKVLLNDTSIAVKSLFDGPMGCQGGFAARIGGDGAPPSMGVFEGALPRVGVGRLMRSE